MLQHNFTKPFVCKYSDTKLFEENTRIKLRHQISSFLSMITFVLLNCQSSSYEEYWWIRNLISFDHCVTLIEVNSYHHWSCLDDGKL